MIFGTFHKTDDSLIVFPVIMYYNTLRIVIQITGRKAQLWMR